MTIFLTKMFMRIHTFIYEKSKGHIGQSLAGIPMLILYVSGRKSGKQYTIPLAYHPEENEYFVVASNSGLPQHPGWYYNVLADENATMRVGKSFTKLTAREVTGEEREAIWQRAIQTNPAWDGYRKKTSRQIPLIGLRPQN